MGAGHVRIVNQKWKQALWEGIVEDNRKLFLFTYGTPLIYGVTIYKNLVILTDTTP